MPLRAEVIAIGDEIISGQRLDTNSQWISQKLGDLGVVVAFHSTVGDVHQDNVELFRIAAARTEIVIATGGLGPTADDLTRQAIADAAGVDLEIDLATLEHIRQIFARHSREMPAQNEVQAYFPVGSRIIENPEGTAPRIDFEFPTSETTTSRIFALPGVPAEMKQMWDASVEPAIIKMTGETRFIHHHVVHCFGIGESQAEAMLPDLITRGRQPKVGITASSATISLRVTAAGASAGECVDQMQDTLNQIREIMGPLIFGENEQQLQDVVIDRLVRLNKTIAVVDCGLNGDVAKLLLSVPNESGNPIVTGGLTLDESLAANWLQVPEFNLKLAAKKIQTEFCSDVGVAIGRIAPPTKSERRSMFTVVIDSPLGCSVKELAFGGHSAIRHSRAVKQVLNELRLFLQATQ